MGCPFEPVFARLSSLLDTQKLLESSLLPLVKVARRIGHTPKHKPKPEPRPRPKPTEASNSSSSSSLAPCHYAINEAHGREPFVYEPLLTDKSIRLFRLAPGNPNDPIRGTLEVVQDIDTTCPSFFALSYTWGKTNKSHHIQCNGRTLNVTCNLHSALARLRDDTNPILIFVDAICIDQSSMPSATAERDVQIQLMRDIYPAASCVIVDLGAEANDSHAAINLLTQFCDINDTKWEALLRGQMTADEFAIPGFHDPAWASLMAFCGREWFTRTWVVQEYALARELKILVGNEFTTAGVLSKGMPRAMAFCLFSGPEVLPGFYNGAGALRTQQMVCDVIGLISKAMPISEKIQFLNDVRATCQQGQAQRFPLSRLLCSTRGLAVKYAEDRVRGILGMCRQEDFEMLTVAGSMASDALSEIVTDLLLARGELFHLLYHLASHVHASTSSWKINLDLPGSIYEFHALNDAARVAGTLGTDKRLPLFRASGDEELNFSRVDKDTLQIRAHLLDTIAWQSEPLAQLAGPARSVLWYHATWDAIFRRRPSHRSALDLRRAFGTTIVAGGRLQPLLRDSSGLVEDLAGHMDAFEQGIAWLESGETQSHFVDPCAADDWRVRAALYAKHVSLACASRCVAMTSKGVLALVPERAREGDVVAILLGGAIPFVLRRVEGVPRGADGGAGGDCYRIVGTAYVDGIMDGEALAHEGWEATDILLR